MQSAIFALVLSVGYTLILDKANLDRIDLAYPVNADTTYM